ncbi:MAG: hypothetical protein QM683_06040 [Lacrimispora sp.]
MSMAHYALQKLHILPGTLQSMNRKEKAFVYASIELRVEEEKRQAAKMKA